MKAEVKVSAEVDISRKIGIKEFITQVKKELREALCEDQSDAFFELNSVQLDMEFVAEKEASGGVKFWATNIGIGGSLKSANTHRVTLILTPFTTEEDEDVQDDIEKITSVSIGKWPKSKHRPKRNPPIMDVLPLDIPFSH